MIYGKRTNGGLHGTVLTKKEIVEAMLDLADYLPSKDLSEIRFVDPSAGEGVFILTALDRLYHSSLRFKFDFYESATASLRSFEIDPEACKRIREKVKAFFLQKNIQPLAGDIQSMVHCSDFLMAKIQADLIIGNPPYVRHEKIPEDQKGLYKDTFKTFTHRSDLYICFYEKALSSLNKAGQLCFICSNRWLKNQYGKGLRDMISSNFSFPLIINMEQANAFDESVLAYPAITLIQNKPSRKSEATKFIDLSGPQDLFNLPKFQHERDFASVYISRSGVQAQKGSSQFENGLKIEDQGFKIGIGVATGADSIFIRSDFEGLIESEILLPIIGSKDLKTGQLQWAGNFVINPFETGSTNLVDLREYPKLRKYLLQHKSRLSERHTAQNSNGKWYKTIDRIYPHLVTQPKLLLPDFGTRQLVYLDHGKFYPHHNLYYITGAKTEELEVLGAILMSEFVGHQLQMIGNKMNGGYVRWQSQNLRKLILPDLTKLSGTIKKSLRTHFKTRDIEAINKVLMELPISIGEGKYELAPTA